MRAVGALAMLLLLGGTDWAGAQDPNAPDGCEYSLELKTGWNLISLPIEPETPSCELIFPDPLTARGVWQCNSLTSRFERTATLQALRAYWVYSAHPVQLRIRGRLLPMAQGDLPAGWNAIGPAAEVPVPDDPELAAKAWAWDPASRQYVQETDRLQPGRGYWFFALRPISAMTLGLPDGDADGDGVADTLESLLGADPVNADTDGDGIPDAWEIRHGFNPRVNDAEADPDGDGLNNRREWELGLDPRASDTGQVRVSFESPSSTVPESAGTLEIGVALSATPPHGNHVTARVRVLGGSATNGSDYELAAPVTLDFSGRGTRRTVTLRLIPDSEKEPPENVTLRLVAIVGALPGRDCEHRITITDAALTADDSDGDGLPDAWELRYFGNLNQGPDDDPDGDGEPNRRECLLGRTPTAGARNVAAEDLNLGVGGVIH